MERDNATWPRDHVDEWLVTLMEDMLTRSDELIAEILAVDSEDTYEEEVTLS